MGSKRKVVLLAALLTVVMLTLVGVSSNGIDYVGGKESYAASTSDNRTGVYKAKYTVNGKSTTEWCYLKKGKVQYNYTGFASNSSGWWYVEKGKVTFKKNDVIKGTIKNQSGWWFVKESKVQFVDSVEKNSLGWWKITGGKVDFTYTGVAKNSSGWWYIKNGKVDFNYTGLAANENGTWYIEKGKVNFSKNYVVKGMVNGQNGWWYVKNGKVDLSYTGTAMNSNGTWYVEKGRVTFNTSGIIKSGNDWIYVKNSRFMNETDSVEKNSNGWWKISKGYVNFCYTGISQNQYGYWYCEKGKVNFAREAFVDGEVNGKLAAWYVKGGKVQTSFSGTITTKDYKVTVKNGEIIAATVLNENVQAANKFILNDYGYPENKCEETNGSWMVLGITYVSGKSTYTDTSNQYDSNGRLVKSDLIIKMKGDSSINGHSSTCLYNYDKMGNLSQIISENEIYSYDKYGNLTKIKGKDYIKKYTNTYDNNGRLIKVRISREPHVDYNNEDIAFDYTYDKNGNLSGLSCTTTEGKIKNYSYIYDSNGKLSEIICRYSQNDSNILSTIVEYNDDGLIKGHKYKDYGYITIYTYDIFGNLILADIREGGASERFVCVYVIK